MMHICITYSIDEYVAYKQSKIYDPYGEFDPKLKTQ